MAITDVAAYAHLSEADLRPLRSSWMRSVATSRLPAAKRTAHTSARAIVFQRFLDVAARLVIAGTRGKAAGRSGPARSRWRRASRTWSSATTSATGNGTG